jgi:hypothetical protein
MAVTPKNALVVLNNNNVAQNSVPLRNNNLTNSRRLNRCATSNSEIYTTVRVSARRFLITEIATSGDLRLRKWEDM